jgi:hypothetical protein
MYIAAFALVVAATAATLGSCHNNPYDLLVHDRFEQADFDGSVDILWVVDNSSSMTEIHAEIQVNFGAFINNFGNIEGGLGELDYNNVTDAVTSWAEFQNNKEAFLDFQMGVTTTDIESPGNGRQGNVRSKSAIGSADTCNPKALTGADAREGTLAGDFQELIDVGTEGSGSETGIAAAAFALCKGQDQAFYDALTDRADDDPVRVLCSAVPVAERSCNAGFFRPEAATVIVIVSDEGDDSYRSGEHPPGETVADCVKDHNDDPLFGQCDCRLEWWMEFFDAMGLVVFATIGPTYQASTVNVPWCDGSVLNFQGPCNAFGADVCAIDFYQQAACLSSGLFTPIQTTPDDDPLNCELANFELALTNIGQLISNLSAGWRLSVVPDPDSIQVFVNDVTVPHVSEAPSGGWRYIPNQRNIGFTGEALPDFNDTVDIYYFPAFDRFQNVGRELPF